MANALPILLLGGAAVLLMAGAKKKKPTAALAGTTIERGDFGEGTNWRIRQDRGKFYVDFDAQGKWVTINMAGRVLSFNSVEEARGAVAKLDSAEWTVDETGGIE